jgi:hypothetical protein
MKKIFGTMFVVLVVTIIVSEHLVKNDLNKQYLKFLDRVDEKKEVYVNGKKIDFPNEIVEGLKYTQAFRFAKNGNFGKCIHIRIMSKNTGMSLCVRKAPGLRYLKVSFLRFYLKSSGWQPLLRSVGTVSQKYINPYIKEALLQNNLSDYHDYHDDITDEEILLRYKACERKEENGWKLEVNDLNTTKEVCKIILRYFDDE